MRGIGGGRTEVRGLRTEDVPRMHGGHPRRTVVVPRRPTIDVCQFASKEGARITGARTLEDILRTHIEAETIAIVRRTH